MSPSDASTPEQLSAMPEGPDSPVIRRATAADASAIHELILALAASIGQRDQVQSTAEDVRRDGFGDAPLFEALLAELQGVPVGFCLFFDSYSSWDGRRGVYVQDLYVAETVRGSGLGRGLLAAVAAVTQDRGGTYLRLSVESDNTAAQKFYEQLGLQCAVAERIYRVRGDDFVALAEAGKAVAP